MEKTMVEINLWTRDGGFVAEASIPHFEIAPEIIRWGERFFVLTANGEYREGMVWVVQGEAV